MTTELPPCSSLGKLPLAKLFTEEDYCNSALAACGDRLYIDWHN
jgi:hypothetical protein